MNAYSPTYSAVRIHGHTVQIDNCHFINNHVGTNGGALDVQAGDVTITNCVFSGNSADGGGAIAHSWAFLEMSGCVFTSNSAEVGGAYHSVWAVETNISGCTFHANEAVTGSAVYLENPYSYLLFAFSSSIISGGVQGEGFHWAGTEALTVSDCDIFGNDGGDWVGNIAGLLGTGGNFSADPLFCDADAGDFSVDQGSPCLPETSPGGVLVGALGIGCGIAPVPMLMGDFAMHCYPNPCNPRANISFTLERAQPVRVEIYALDGRRIVQLADRVFGAGEQTLSWNGRDGHGGSVASGTYFVRLASADGVASEKLLLLR